MGRLVSVGASAMIALVAMVSALGAQDTKYSSAWELIKSEHDKNGDGKVSAAEYGRGETRFARLDRNGDGFITQDELSGGRGRGRGRAAGGGGPTMSTEERQARMLGRLLGADTEVTRQQVDAWFADLDKDKNGKLVEAELTCVSDLWRGLALRRLDSDKDQALSSEEIGKAYTVADKDKNGKLSVAEMGRGRPAAGRGRRGRGGNRGGGRGRTARRVPQVGEVAPDFTLKSLDGKSKHTLSSFKDKKPVALIFGSYT